MSDSKAYLELNEHTWVRTIWFAQFGQSDVLAWMYRPNGEPWRIGYRFRRHVDDKVFDSGDVKTAYTITPSCAEPSEAELSEIAGKIDAVINTLAEVQASVLGTGLCAQRLDCNCLGPAAAEMVAAQRWGHVYRAGQMGAKPKRGKS